MSEILRNWLNCLLSDIQSDCEKSSLDLEFLVGLYDKQDGRCALSKMELKYRSGNFCSIVVDRKNPGKGFMRRNVRLICEWVDLVKRERSDEEFLGLLADVRVGEFLLGGTNRILLAFAESVVMETASWYDAKGKNIFESISRPIMTLGEWVILRYEHSELINPKDRRAGLINISVTLRFSPDMTLFMERKQDDNNVERIASIKDFSDPNTFGKISRVVRENLLFRKNMNINKGRTRFVKARPGI